MKRVAFLVVAGTVPALAQWDLGEIVPVHGGLVGWQESSCLDVDAAGRFFVAFEDLQSDDAGNGYWSIRGAFLPAPAGSRTQDFSLSDGAFARSCDVDQPGAGSGRAVWVSDSSSPEVFLGISGAPFDSLSSRTGPAQELTTEATFFANTVRTAVWEDGSFVILWLESAEGSEEQALFARRYDAAGEPLGERVLIEPPRFPGAGFYFDVATQAQGYFVIVWSREGLDGDGFGVILRRYDTQDAAVGTDRVVNQHLLGDQFDCRIAADARGGLFVIWTSYGQDGSGGGVYARRLRSDGVPLGPEFQVSSGAPSHQADGDVSLDAYGNAAVAWYSESEEGGYFQDIWARLYRSDGSSRGDQFLVNTDGVAQEQVSPSVALSDGGILGVSYTTWRPEEPGSGEYGYDTLFRRIALPCELDGETLCLQGGRFVVRAFWRTVFGDSGAASAIPLTAESGGFWFFAPDNFEMLVKVLDGCGTNGSFWLFFTGLTDVAVDLVVTDTWTGTTQTHRNPMGASFQPFQEVSAFPVCAAVDPQSRVKEAPRQKATPRAEGDIAPDGPCEANGTSLCLEGGRFRARVAWSDFAGNVGAGQAIPLGDDSGLFWFFWPDNIEIAVKVLDGCGVNGRYWVFAAGLTSVRVDLEVTDLATSQTWETSTTLGERFPSFLDASAFPTCPQVP